MPDYKACDRTKENEKQKSKYRVYIYIYTYGNVTDIYKKMFMTFALGKK